MLAKLGGPLNRTAPARNIGHTDAKGTSSAGCAVKTNTNGMSVFARLRQRRSQQQQQQI